MMLESGGSTFNSEQHESAHMGVDTIEVLLGTT
jgi:hypothetical protein